MAREKLSEHQLASNPRGDALWERGRQHNANGQYKSAIECFRSAQATDRNDPRFYNGEGWSHLKLGKYEKAESLFDKAISLNSGIWQYHCNRADARRELGNFEGAFESLNRVEALVPSKIDDIEVNRQRVRTAQREAEATQRQQQRISDEIHRIEQGFNEPHTVGARIAADRRIKELRYGKSESSGCQIM